MTYNSPITNLVIHDGIYKKEMEMRLMFFLKGQSICKDDLIDGLSPCKAYLLTSSCVLINHVHV